MFQKNILSVLVKTLLAETPFKSFMQESQLSQEDLSGSSQDPGKFSGLRYVLGRC